VTKSKMTIQNLIKLAKFIYKIANFIISLLGIMILVILCVYSILIVKGMPEPNPHLNLSPFLTANLVYVWLGTLVITVISLPIWLVIEIRKGIKKAKDPKLSGEEKARSLFWWLFKN